MQANYFEAEFLQLYPSSERERNFRRCSFTSSIKREIGLFFSSRSRAATPKKCTNKHAAPEELLFFPFNLLLFLTFSLPSPLGRLKVPNSGFEYP